MNGSVTVLLVSHDGERWLPSVLRQLSAQTARPDRVVAVDTGSADRSVAQLQEQLPGATVVALDRATAFPAAVRAGLEQLPPVGEEDWIWLLHDDSAPAPDALEHLLAAARTSPDADILGPKIREWPSLRRLLEVGVTVSGTGHRETGLERGEHDQGQHDEPREVLAVNTAGMLVRRTVLERLGLDDQLPVVHTDLDFGWRAARAGHRVQVVPDAVLFHAEASRHGLREHEQRGTHDRAARRRRDREASLYILLANCGSWAVPLVTLRLSLGTLLRALGLVLVRAPVEGVAELRALGATLGRPGRVLRGRRRRRSQSTVPARAVRHLLASPLLPYRHGWEELTEIGSAAVQVAGSRSGERDGGRSWPQRLVRSPGLWTFLLLAFCALVAARAELGSGRLAGGALLPAPSSALDWLLRYAETSHDVGTGSTVAAPAYLVPLGLLGLVLLGSASLVVDLLVLGAAPIAAIGGYHFLVRVSNAPRSSAWGGATYAVLLVVGGAVTQGRVGTLAAAVVLPWLALSALGLAADDPDRRWRAAWRTTLWLTVGGAFAPVLWWLAAAVTLLVLATGFRRRSPGWWRPLLVPVAVTALLLVPWVVPAWSDRGWSALLLEAGLPASALVDGASALELLGGRTTSISTGPLWTGLVVALLATVALARRTTLRPVLAAWGLALLALAGHWALAGVEVTSPSGSGTEIVWTGLLVLVVHGAWITAAVCASSGLRASLSGRSFDWRQPLGLVLVLLALTAPAVGAGWWVAHGSGDPVGRVTSAVPVYMHDAAERDPAAGTVLLRGTSDTGYDVDLLRGHMLSLGEDALLPAAKDQATFTGTVRDLVTAPGPQTVSDLATAGVAFVFAPEPVDPGLAGTLDATPQLSPASAADTGGRAWRLELQPTLPSNAVATADRLRPLWLLLQVAGLVAVAVLAAPTTRRDP